MNGSTDAEAVMFGGKRTTYITYSDVGFIASGDWNHLDARTLLSDLRNVTNAGNSARGQAGLPTIQIDRWIPPPQFDSRRAVATCMYAIHDSTGASGDNAIALVLGRNGYELFSLFGVGSDTYADRVVFTQYIERFKFPSGRRYEDHVSRDKRSAFDLPDCIPR